jgi:hypothetical protein
MTSIWRDAFDRDDLLAHGRSRRNAAGSDRSAIEVHRARTALADAAAELGAGEPDVIAYHPQQGCLQVCVNGMRRSIHDQLERHTFLRIAEL